MKEITIITKNPFFMIPNNPTLGYVISHVQKGDIEIQQDASCFNAGRLVKDMDSSAWCGLTSVLARAWFGIIKRLPCRVIDVTVRHAPAVINFAPKLRYPPEAKVLAKMQKDTIIRCADDAQIELVFREEVTNTVFVTSPDRVLGESTIDFDDAYALLRRLSDLRKPGTAHSGMALDAFVQDRLWEIGTNVDQFNRVLVGLRGINAKLDLFSREEARQVLGALYKGMKTAGWFDPELGDRLGHQTESKLRFLAMLRNGLQNLADLKREGYPIKRYNFFGQRLNSLIDKACNKPRGDRAWTNLRMGCKTHVEQHGSDFSIWIANDLGLQALAKEAT